jgi:hypothetical protein
MGFPNIGNGNEQLLPGQYKVICPKCGYGTRIAHLVLNNKKTLIICDSCGNKIDLNSIINTPYLQKTK